MKHSIRKILFFTAVIPIMIWVMMSHAEPTLQRDLTLQDAIDRLDSKQSNPAEVRLIASSFPVNDVIRALENRIRNDPAFAAGSKARKRAFQTLLQVSDYDERGIRVYTDPRQIDLFVQALNDQEWGVTDSILRIIHLADKRYFEQIVPAVESRFDTQSFSILRNVIHALGKIGTVAESSLPKLRDYVAKPLATSLSENHPILWKKITENPLSDVPEGWREEMLKQAPQAFAKNEVSIRSAASLARLRIDISLLPSEIVLYRTLDPLGQHAGALAIFGAAIETKGVFDGVDETSIAAAKYLADYGSNEEARGSLIEIIGAFSVVLHSKRTSPAVRRAWAGSLEHLITHSNDPEFAKVAASLIE